MMHNISPSAPDRSVLQDQLIDRLVELQHQEIPEHLADVARTVIADAMAVRALNLTSSQSEGNTQAPFPITEHELQTQALIFARQIHGQDFDDTHDASMLHCAAPVIAPALAYCLFHDLTLHHLIRAVIAGYEALTLPFRLGMQVQQGALPTISYGALGTASALLTLKKTTRQQLAAGLSLAASSTGGHHSRQIMDDSPEHKVAQVFPSITSGFTASDLNNLSAFTETQWLTGRYGLVQEPTVENYPGPQWGIEEISFKLYPTVRYSHASIEVAQKVREQLDPTQISNVIIRVPTHDQQGRRIHFHAGQPWNPDVQEWNSFSIPWLVATTLLFGAGTVISQNISPQQAQTIASLATRVKVLDDIAESPNGLIPATITVLDHEEQEIGTQTLASLPGTVATARSETSWLSKLGFCSTSDYSPESGTAFLDHWSKNADAKIRELI